MNWSRHFRFAQFRFELPNATEQEKRPEMDNYYHEVKVGRPSGRAFVRVGVTHDNRLCAEFSREGVQFPKEILVMLAQPFAELMSEAISELPDPTTASRMVNAADDALQRAESAANNRGNNERKR